MIVCEAGAAEMKKLSTVNVTFAEWVRTPSVAVIVSGKLPLGVVPAVVVMLRLELPEPITEAGVKVGVAPAGRPLTLKLTVPAYPFRAATVAV
jgi:hypothetical protein